MSIQASTILDEAAVTLLDVAGRTWTPSDLLGYLNEAMRVTAGAKPDFYVIEAPVTLAVGVIQMLPADGITLVDVPRNTGGRIVTQVDKTLLDESNRFWPAATKQAQVEHFTTDPRNPLRYTVFPPNNGAGVVDLVYSAVPPQIMYAAEELPVLDSYQSALFNFVLAKAYQKNSKRQDLSKSSGYMAQWGQLIGLKASGQAASASKVAAQPGTA